MLNACRHFNLFNKQWVVRGMASSTVENFNIKFENEKDHTSGYRHARIGNFFQDRPVLYNPYLSDPLLKSFLRRNISEKNFKDIDDDLTRFGQRISENIEDHGLKCEQNPPTMKHYDAWGKRIDQIDTCESWNYMKKVSAEEGLIAIGYERNQSSESRLYQMAKMYLFNPSSGLYSCPLAMTDGATNVIEALIKDPSSDTGFLGNAYRRLTSRDPNLFWTSGQWMTEKRGGSDVANGTETVAQRQADGTFHLYGYKWFTSAIDADITFTLARVIDKDGDVEFGSRGLSLFFLETRGEGGGLNGIQVQRLKDKLGTRQLPTAELLLDGTVAHQVGAESHGVRFISRMLTLTRIHNAISAASIMRRILQLAVDYSYRRTAFGAKISAHGLHVQTLARMDVECRGAFLLVFELVRLLGLEEVGEATKQDSNLIRLLTTVAKLYTAKQAVAVCSEGLECFGGAGYLEDTGLPKYLRDAQVLSIWEGTTNILSLDVLRAIDKSGGEVISHFIESVNGKLQKVRNCKRESLVNSCKVVDEAMVKFAKFMENASSQSKEYLTLSARDLSYSLARIYMATLLLEHAAWEGASQSDIYAAKRWCEQDLCPVAKNSMSGCYNVETNNMDKELVYESYLGKM